MTDDAVAPHPAEQADPLLAVLAICDHLAPMLRCYRHHLGTQDAELAQVGLIVPVHELARECVAYIEALRSRLSLGACSAARRL